MKFELISLDIKPEQVKIRRIKRALIYDELEISYIKRITGKDIRPSLRR